MQGRSMLEEVRSHRGEILRTAGRYGVKNVRIFGSVARGEADEKSDIDFLVDIEDGRNLMDLVGFWQDVEDLLGHRADVLSDEGLSPYLKDQILGEAVGL